MSKDVKDVPDQLYRHVLHHTSQEGEILQHTAEVAILLLLPLMHIVPSVSTAL